MPRHSKSVRWRRSQRLDQDINLHGDSLVDLLRDRGSLTQRMKRRCGGEFSVQVLSQQKLRLNRDEWLLLHMPAHERAVVREVLLLCDGQPWVYAHTVIPLSTLTGRETRLAKLGTKPLGAALFADPCLQRDIVEFGWLVPGSRQHGLAQLGGDETAWGRRSRFLLHGKPLLVSEFFLPRWGQCQSACVAGQ